MPCQGKTSLPWGRVVRLSKGSRFPTRSFDNGDASRKLGVPWLEVESKLKLPEYWNSKNRPILSYELIETKLETKTTVQDVFEKQWN